MQTWTFVTLDDPKGVVGTQDGQLWLPLSESLALSERTETVGIAGAFFDVIGYSAEREALLIEPLIIDGAAEDLELEVAAHIAEKSAE